MMQVPTWEDIQRRLVRHRSLELQWVLLLSQLEYMGCRKILRGVRIDSLNASVLEHAHEEALHALLFKQVCEKEGLKIPYAQGIFSHVGFDYFQNVDRQISERVSQSHGPQFVYPSVSWIIEQRVLSVYPTYLKATSFPSIERALRTILIQEKKHSAQFESCPEDIKRTAEETESPLWNKFLKNISEILDKLDALGLDGEAHLQNSMGNSLQSL